MQALPRDNCCIAYKNCICKFANFSGRARRSEYWYFKLLYYVFLFIIFIPLGFIKDEKQLNNVASIVYLVYSLIFLLPNLAVTVRRIHDTGRSGCYYFMIFIPIIGPFIIIYYCICDSQEEPNEYGPSPKYLEIKDTFLGKINKYNEIDNYQNNSKENNTTNYTSIQMNEYSNSYE